MKLASVRRINLIAIVLLVHCQSLLSFQPLIVMPSVFNRIEGWVAGRKVNKDLNESSTKYTVGLDADYSYAATQPKVDHALWDGVMKRHVVPGNVEDITTNVVDYRAVANDEDVEKYRRVLSSANIDNLESTPNELLALYINAYNCLCIGHVTRHMNENGGALPKSVTKTTPPSEKGKEIWDVKAGNVGGKILTLNDIEHKILRSKWEEPRVHASIVCASASCPNLRADAFVPHRLNEQLDDQAKSWVGDITKGVKIDDKGQATFSRIFLWFEGDFKASGGPMAWAKQYLEDDVAEKLSDGKEPKYFPYNWSLNNKQ